MVFLLHDYRQYHWELGEVLLELANNNTRVLLGIATTTTHYLPSSFCFHCNNHHHLHLLHKKWVLYHSQSMQWCHIVTALCRILLFNGVKTLFLLFSFPTFFFFFKTTKTFQCECVSCIALSQVCFVDICVPVWARFWIAHQFTLQSCLVICFHFANMADLGCYSALRHYPQLWSWHKTQTMQNQIK